MSARYGRWEEVRGYARSAFDRSRSLGDQSLGGVPAGGSPVADAGRGGPA